MNNFFSIRTKLFLVVMFTIFAALLVTGVILFIYDINSYRDTRVNDMSTQVELLAYSAAPALQFRDQEGARENVNLLQVRPTVSAAAIYDANGEIFASYLREGVTPDFPEFLMQDRVSISGNDLEIFRIIEQNGTFLGTIYMRADYGLQARALNFVGILVIITVGAMLVALLISIWLQSLITRPMLSIASVARDVVTRKEYTRRAEKLSDDEVGQLVDAFNDMLEEIQLRTRALEDTNRELEQEIVERKRAREEVERLNEELEKKVDELRERDRYKDDFLATLAHELRNPLAPIRTGLEVIREVDENRREKIYAILERQTHQLVRLVDDLMDVSRISRGKVSLQKQVVSLDEVMQVAVEAISGLMQQKRHHLDVQMPEETVFIYGDPVRLSQVFLNLLSNAAHYTNAGGNIVLKATCDRKMLEISVQDNGIGMSSEMLEKIFEAFIQIENPHTRARTGLGIGLTLARALIDKHGGTIRADSAGPGKGTRFTVHLPLASVGVVAPAPVPNVTALRDLQHRILVVDDNEDAALTLAMLLRLMGHEVRVVFNGVAALEEGEQFLPHIILMDLGMPGMNGIDTALEIRQRPWGKKLILVAVTGWGQDEDKRKTWEAGFNFHLVKPVQVSDIESLFTKLEIEMKQVSSTT